MHLLQPFFYEPPPASGQPSIRAKAVRSTRRFEDVLGSPHKPPALPVVPGSMPPIQRKAFQVPSGSFLSTASPVPRTCFTSASGDSTYEAVNERHSTAQPPSRIARFLVPAARGC